MIEKDKLLTLNKKDRTLVSSILDKYRQYQKTKKGVASNFLNPSEMKLVTNYLNYYQIPYSIYDKYPFLEKKIIYFGEYESYLTFYQIKADTSLTHSEILGSLFALGLNDNVIGDIFVEKNSYYVSLSKLDSYLLENFHYVGNKLIELIPISELSLTENHFQNFTIMVSSMRVDIIVSKLANKSRSQVKDLITSKKIFLNYQELKNNSILLKENDILSIRHVGKFKIGTKLGNTKKDNIILEINQYK